MNLINFYYQNPYDFIFHTLLKLSGIEKKNSTSPQVLYLQPHHE